MGFPCPFQGAVIDSINLSIFDQTSVLVTPIRLVKSQMLQVLGTRMGFPSPFRNVVIGCFSPTSLFFVHFSISDFNVVV